MKRGRTFILSFTSRGIRSPDSSRPAPRAPFLLPAARLPRSYVALRGVPVMAPLVASGEGSQARAESCFLHWCCCCCCRSGDGGRVTRIHFAFASTTTTTPSVKRTYVRRCRHDTTRSAAHDKREDPGWRKVNGWGYIYIYTSNTASGFVDVVGGGWTLLEVGGCCRAGKRTKRMRGSAGGCGASTQPLSKLSKHPPPTLNLTEKTK